MQTSTKKWLFIKISSVVLLPLKLWFMYNFSLIMLSDASMITSFLSNQPTKFIFSIFLIVFLFFFSLTLSEIFEDYIRGEKIKNVANKVLYIFVILLSLIVIISVYRF